MVIAGTRAEDTRRGGRVNARYSEFLTALGNRSAEFCASTETSTDINDVALCVAAQTGSSGSGTGSTGSATAVANTWTRIAATAINFANVEIDFIDSNTGWIVGQGGTILKTTNGGATWSRLTTGTNYYYSVYAESSKAMAGGYAGKVKKIIDDDISQAKDALTKKLKAENEATLRNSISSDYVLLDDMISSEIISASTEAKAGTVADNFTYQVKVKSKALAFKKSDLEKFAKDYIIFQIQETKTMLDNSFKTDYSSKASDIDKGKITLNLTFSSGVYQDIDKKLLARFK